MLLGMLSLLGFAFLGSTVDPDGVLREPFALLPVGFALLAIGVVLIAAAVVKKARDRHSARTPKN